MFDQEDRWLLEGKMEVRFLLRKEKRFFFSLHASIGHRSRRIGHMSRRMDVPSSDQTSKLHCFKNLRTS
jgi:hypothetical protein